MSSVPGVADAALQQALVLGHVQGGWQVGNREACTVRLREFDRTLLEGRYQM